MQALRLDASSWNWMQALGTGCKILELDARSSTCMQAYVTASKLLELHTQACETTSKLMQLEFQFADRRMDRQTHGQTL